MAVAKNGFHDQQAATDLQQKRTQRNKKVTPKTTHDKTHLRFEPQHFAVNYAKGDK